MPLSNLQTDANIQDEQDVIGGYQPLESGLYNHKVTLAYINPSAGGALGLVLHLEDETGKELRYTAWMTSGVAKGQRNYYERNGQKHYLPGFILANSLCLLTVGKEISQMDTEEKVINIYSREAGAEVPTKVQMLTELLGAEIISGVIKQKVDRTQRNDAGEYVPTGETREENEIDKFFRASDRMTTAEIRAQASEATFINQWEARWKGQVRDRSTGAAQTGTAGAPLMAAAKAKQTNTKPTQSLFG